MNDRYRAQLATVTFGQLRTFIEFPQTGHSSCPKHYRWDKRYTAIAQKAEAVSRLPKRTPKALGELRTNARLCADLFPETLHALALRLIQGPLDYKIDQVLGTKQGNCVIDGTDLIKRYLLVPLCLGYSDQNPRNRVVRVVVPVVSVKLCKKGSQVLG